MKHTTNQKIVNAYRLYKKSRLFDISDAYKKPSDYKIDIWYSLQMYYYNTPIRILTFNTFTFTAGTITRINGILCFVWITSENTRYITLEELTQKGE